MGLFKRKNSKKSKKSKKDKDPSPSLTVEHVVKHVNVLPGKRVSFSFGRKLNDGDYGNYEASYWEDELILPGDDGKVNPAEVKKARDALVKRVMYEVYYRLYKQGATPSRAELERAGIVPRSKIERIDGAETI